MIKFLLVLIFIPYLATGQNLNGFWKGKITQDTGGYAPDYNLEVNIVQKKNYLSGETKAYLGKIVIERLGFYGYIKKDSVYLFESEQALIENVQPPEYKPCVKNFVLTYKKDVNGNEILFGRWDGIGLKNNTKMDNNLIDSLGFILDDPECIPGLVYLSKNDALKIETNQPTQVITFTDTLKGTHINKFKEIVVYNQIVVVSISDYEEVDGDRVSVFMNREVVEKNIGVRRVPYIFTLALNPNYITNELSILADNLGKIPPNTSLIVIKDGDFEHKVYISSDLKNTAAIYLKYKKP
ncbi:hypothetical protein [Pedobacter cryophilus]|uniref:Uncharacterized protein n=1 Tax=Pedobacter cryophilus TaxID=2571271 RepID=A0A4U1C1M9_9SPHI|nr:hypothetical protein [Pedobacter cryophilus]TKB98887.1 hypothetical protein FA046_07165 [Pedobacter cryophilus]